MGILHLIAAHITWGLFPLVWKGLNQISSWEIIAHRIIWSFVFASLVVIVSGRLPEAKEVIANKKSLLGVLLCGMLVSLNWLIYIWAVNSNQLVEASLAYFINPMVIIFFGLVFFKERLSVMKYLAIFIAFVGVAVLTIQYGRVPWIALSLALIWGLYSLVKKATKVESFLGLAFESLATLPAALIYLGMKQIDGTGSVGLLLPTWFLLVFSGTATSITLYWFARAARVLPLATIGLFQFISPSIGLMLAVFIYQEPFGMVDLLAFGLIWFACAIYSVSLYNSDYSERYGGKRKLDV